MEILLAFIFGGTVGMIAHYAVPGRDLRGAALAPIIGALIGGAVWLALTWAGLTVTDFWLWLAAAIAPVVVVFLGIPVLTRIRRAHDARELARLGLA